MYKEIDELVDAIVSDEKFKDFQRSQELLKDDDVYLLLSKHQSLQDDYMRLKQYENYVSIDETKEQLKEIKKQLMSHPYIQQYYQSYYQLNDLLEEVTHLVFDGISEEIEVNRWSL